VLSVQRVLLTKRKLGKRNISLHSAITHQARSKLTKKKLPLFLDNAPLCKAFKKTSTEMGELHYPLNFVGGGKTTKGERNGAHTQNNYGSLRVCVRQKKVVRTKKHDHNSSFCLLAHAHASHTRGYISLAFGITGVRSTSEVANARPLIIRPNVINSLMACSSSFQ
jgi:hypothetical protein